MRITLRRLAIVLFIGVALAATATVVGAQDVTADPDADIPAWDGELTGELSEWMETQMSGAHSPGEHAGDHAHGEHAGDHAHGEHANYLAGAQLDHQHRSGHC